MTTDFTIDPGVSGLVLRLELNDALGALSSGLKAMKVDATRDPLPTDTAPWVVGSRWIRTDTGHEWVCTSNEGGVATWVPTTTVGGSGGAAGGPGAVQIAGSGGVLAADGALQLNSAAKTLAVPYVGDKIHAAGNISGAWSPPLNGAGTITGTATGDITLNVPSGLALPPDREVYLKLLISAAAQRKVTYNLGNGADQYAVLHTPPMSALQPGCTHEIVLRWQGDGVSGGRWYLVGPTLERQQISFLVPGVPPASTALWGMYVHNGGFSARPAIYIPYRDDDIGSTSCVTAPSATTVFSIQRALAATPNTWAQIGTATFAAGVPGYVTWDFGGSVHTLTHGDKLRVVAPANLNGLQDLNFILAYAG